MHMHEPSAAADLSAMRRVRRIRKDHAAAFVSGIAPGLELWLECEERSKLRIALKKCGTDYELGKSPFNSAG